MLGKIASFCDTRNKKGRKILRPSLIISAVFVSAIVATISSVSAIVATISSGVLRLRQLVELLHLRQLVRSC